MWFLQVRPGRINELNLLKEVHACSRWSTAYSRQHFCSSLKAWNPLDFSGICWAAITVRELVLSERAVLRLSENNDLCSPGWAGRPRALNSVPVTEKKIYFAVKRQKKGSRRRRNINMDLDILAGVLGLVHWFLLMYLFIFSFLTELVNIL